MTTVPELQRLARQVTGEPREALERLLLLLCEQLGMDVGFVASLEGTTRTVRAAAARSGQVPDGLLGLCQPLEETWCGGVVLADPLLVRDAADDPALSALPVTASLGVGSYAGTVLRDASGAAIGTMCAFGSEPQRTLGSRDEAVLVGLGEVVAPLLQTLLAPAPVRVLPAPRPAPDLASVAAAVQRADDLEQLTRPLLDALHEMSGLASTYLTVVHEELGHQEIRYARNERSADGFAVAEGLELPWRDTLCKRSLDEGVSCTTEVQRRWGDVPAAQDLGIVTYVSVPVRLADGSVWGTLCAADDAVREDAEAVLPTLTLFARLIAGEVERTAAVSRERERAEQARREAETDDVTGCASRRVVQPWLERSAASLRAGEVLAAVYVDVDRFKRVNDAHGHAVGDALLAELGRRLRGVARPDDLVARLGGDELVVVARLPLAGAEPLAERVRIATSFVLAHGPVRVAVRCSTGLATSAEVGGVEGLLMAADRRMYEDKAPTA